VRGAGGGGRVGDEDDDEGKGKISRGKNPSDVLFSTAVKLKHARLIGGLRGPA